MKKKEKTLATIVCEFRDYQELKGVSESTVGMDIFAIKCFMKAKDELSEAAVKQYIKELKDSELSLATKNIRLSHLRVFLYWCMQEGYLNEFKINLFKGQEPKIKFFTDEEVALLLKAPKKTFIEHRMHTICSLICATGARLSTIINLKLEDLNFKEKTITFRHLKNKSSAILPMTETLRVILKQYTNTWELKDYVFTDTYGNKLTVSAFEQAFHKYCKSRGVNPKGPHALRHAFARIYIKNGGDAFTLQRLLTHSSMEMTRRYVELFSEDLRKPLETFNPLDNYRSRRLKSLP